MVPGLPLGNDVSAADDVIGCSDGWPLGIDVGTASDNVGCNVSTKIPLYLMSSSHNYAIKKNDQERQYLSQIHLKIPLKSLGQNL